MRKCVAPIWAFFLMWLGNLDLRMRLPDVYRVLTEGVLGTGTARDDGRDRGVGKLLTNHDFSRIIVPGEYCDRGGRRKPACAWTGLRWRPRRGRQAIVGRDRDQAESRAAAVRCPKC